MLPMFRMLAPLCGISPIRRLLIIALWGWGFLAGHFGMAVAQVAAVNDKPLPPETVSLNTTDGKALTATYYPSRAGKEAPAILLLHPYHGKRADLAPLALKLQLGKCAVIVPDLRGHGDSRLGIKDLRPDDYADMIRRDLEAVKGFLMKKNNQGELNIERLGIVGVELGASLALNWAALDWSWPMLATGKQGQDVKALVLISPEWSFKGVRIAEAVVDPAVQNELAMLIVTGRRNPRMLSESKRLFNTLAKHHNVSPSLPIEKQMLVYKTPPTSLQGLSLLNEKSLGIEQLAADFLEVQLSKPSYAWHERKAPL